MGRPRGRQVEGPILREITEMIVRERWTPAQIHRELKKRHAKDVPDPVPNPKTIQRIWREWTTDDSDVWRFADEDTTPEDARLVLRVLDALQSSAVDPDDEDPRQPVVWTVSKLEAKWIVRISRTDRGIPANWCYALARAYIAGEAAERSTQPLDRLMASRMWDTEAMSYWQDRVDAGYENEDWQSIEYAADLLPFLPGPWRPGYRQAKFEANEAYDRMLDTIDTAQADESKTDKNKKGGKG